MIWWGYGNSFYDGFAITTGFLLPFVIFDLVLKGFTLWKSARKSQNIWFIALLLVNSLGLLPLVYLVLNRDQKKAYSGVDKRKSK